MKNLRLADWPLLIKIGFAPAVALLMLAVLAFVSVTAQKNASSELRQVVGVEMAKSLKMQSLAERITDAHGRLYMLLTHQAGKIDQAKIGTQAQALVKELKDIETAVGEVAKTASPKQKPLFVKLGKQLDETRSAVDLVSGMMTADFSAAVSFIAPFEQSYQQMVDTLSKVVALTQRNTNERARISEANAERMQSLIMIASLITLLLVAAIASVSVLATRGDARKIARATETLAGGDNSIDLEALARKDEFGAIVRSLTVFRDSQLRMVEMRREQEDAREAAAREQELVVSSLAAGLDHLATGDLTFRVTAEFPGEYRKLREDFNAAMHKLEDTLRVIWRSTTNIQTGATEMSQAADDLSRRTEHQAETLEQTAITLDGITNSVQSTAEGAINAREAVSTTKDDAERSGRIVGDAVNAMQEIEASASQISQIVSVIDEIAFQTNLLALNAGVEAARAGDAGKGFAVVASEVRGLARRSAEAAKKIRTLIDTSTDKVNQGVSLVGEAGEALARIVSQVTAINDVVNQIAASAQEESTSVGQVNTAVNDLDGFTQQNAAMVQQSTASSHSLAKEADELARLLNRFKVNGAEKTGTTQQMATAAMPARAA